MTEEFLKYRKMAIMVLAKALDDICPTFDIETADDRKRLIDERIAFFARTEVELDAEWQILERNAAEELERFKIERDEIFSKIALTDNSARVAAKVAKFEEKKLARVEYLMRKLERDVAVLEMRMELFKQGSRKYAQLNARKESLHRNTMERIRRTEHRYNTIIKNTMNSDNSDRVANRLAMSRKVWERKFKELVAKHEAQEEVFSNKSMIYDQIRLSMAGFEQELDYFKHWCIIADVPLRLCYEEAIRRAKKVKRSTSKLEEVLSIILKEGV